MSIRSSTNSSGDIGCLGSSTFRLLHIELSSFLNFIEDALGALQHLLLKLSLKPSVDNYATRFILFARTILSDMYSERVMMEHQESARPICCFCTFHTWKHSDVISTAELR